jgi:hypothetical protein
MMGLFFLVVDGTSGVDARWMKTMMSLSSCAEF